MDTHIQLKPVKPRAKPVRYSNGWHVWSNPYDVCHAMECKHAYEIWLKISGHTHRKTADDRQTN